jgi:hypothetical protein
MKKANPTLPFVLGGSDELILIFHSSVQTSRRNASLERGQSPDSRG